MNDPVGRIDFVRQLYNLLCVELDREQEQDTQSAILELNRRIENHPMKSMYTEDGNRAGEGGGDGRAQLLAHGYEVQPELVAETLRWQMGPTFQGPSNLFSAYLPC